NAQIAAFRTALRMKGETVEELIGFAQVVRQKAVRVRTRPDDVAGLTGTDRDMLIDTCGTGGDAAGTFNVSTATAFVVAGAGLRVAKHGNRSVSSLCGSADVVETLGVNLDLSPEKVARCVEEVGIGFLYAPLLHTAMKHVMAARREMGVRTVFNMLGPLTNPAGANAQVIGVYSPALTEPLARVLAELRPPRPSSRVVARGTSRKASSWRPGRSTPPPLGRSSGGWSPSPRSSPGRSEPGPLRRQLPLRVLASRP